MPKRFTVDFVRIKTNAVSLLSVQIKTKCELLATLGTPSCPVVMCVNRIFRIRGTCTGEASCNRRTMRNSGRGKIRFIPLLLLVVMLGASLRFWSLGASSIWLDEAYSWSQSKDSITDLLVRTVNDNYPPLHNLVLWAQIKLFGDSELSLRFPSAVFSTLDLVAVFSLTRAIGGTRAGLMATALLAVIPFHILHAHNARMYSLFSLMATLYLWAAISYCRKPCPRSALFGGVTAVLLLYSHFYGTLIFISVNATVLFLARWRNRAVLERWRGWYQFQASAFVLFSPWFFLLALRGAGIAYYGFWTPDVDVQFVAQIVCKLFDWPTLLLVAECALFLSVSKFASARSGATEERALRATLGNQPFMDGIAIATAAVVGPIIFATLFSIVFEPIMLPRYFIFVIPATLALLSTVISGLPCTILTQWLVVSVTTALLFQSVLRDGALNGFGAQWRQLAATQTAYLLENDRTVVFPKWVSPPYIYYMRDNKIAAQPDTLEDALKPLDSAPRVWFVMRTRSGVAADLVIGKPEKDRIVASYVDAGYHPEHDLTFGSLYLFLMVHD